MGGQVNQGNRPHGTGCGRGRCEHLDEIKGSIVAPLVRNPTYLHMDSVGASDASTTDDWDTHSGDTVEGI